MAIKRLVGYSQNEEGKVAGLLPGLVSIKMHSVSEKNEYWQDIYNVSNYLFKGNIRDAT